MIVVDSNVIAARNMEHAKSIFAEQVDRVDQMWIAPPLWRYEFQNILAKALWAKRLTLETAVETWQRVKDAMSENEYEPSPERVIELSGRYRITSYDANFIALAMELGVKCVTEDGELHEKFPAIAIGMEKFVSRGQGSPGVRETRASYHVRKRRRGSTT